MHARVLLLAAALLVVGCKKGKTESLSASQKSIDRPVTERILKDEGLTLVEIDLNADDKPEIYNYYRERTDAPRLLVKKETDLNADGKIDVISYYAVDGQLEKEETDGDFDGSFDMTDYFRNGRRVMAEVDTDFDGRPNVYKYYQAAADGRMFISHEERDSDGDGQIDFWIRFDDKGMVIKTGADTDGDGKMDTREE